MKTEITRRYKYGFILSEQELRRIVKAVTEHAYKASADAGNVIQLSAVLHDGSIIQTQLVDDFFSIENGGLRRITQVDVDAKPAPPAEDWRIWLTFLDGSKNAKSWNSIELDIKSESRDWALVAASDLEDRIKRTKIISWDALLGTRAASNAVILAGMVLMVLLFPVFVLDAQSHVRLQTLYDAGVLTDPVKAIIEVERMKNEVRPGELLRLMGVSFGIPMALLLLATRVLPWIRPSYNFCWGDYVAIFEKRRQRRNVIWTVLVLGLIVSIVAGVVTKKIGF